MVKAMNTVLNLPARATQVCHPHMLLPLTVKLECCLHEDLPLELNTPLYPASVASLEEARLRDACR